ncbi:GNAT family N-acetyltransferase [Luteolibacter soli]|uniref:GNAT family N-acetyltransferase n=1 Tax=Luteolibacter soli TaxID=3135280 RepID=A0ABU9B3M0_9BACT
MPDDHPAFFAGEYALLASAAVLDDLQERFGAHPMTPPEMSRHAGKRVCIKGVGIYHFGTILYQFDEPEGHWLEEAIVDLSLAEPFDENMHLPAHLIYEATTDSDMGEPGLVSIRRIEDQKLFCSLHRLNAGQEAQNINATALIRSKIGFESRYGFHGEYPRPPLLNLRAALPADQAALADLYLRSRRAAFTWRNPEDFQLDDFTRDTEGELIHLAEYEDGTLLGFISLWEAENFIHHLFVCPDHLRQGIGLILLTDLQQRIPGPFRLKCLTANLPALAFYRDIGWTEVDQGTSDDGEYLLLESPH